MSIKYYIETGVVLWNYSRPCKQAYNTYDGVISEYVIKEVTWCELEIAIGEYVGHDAKRSLSLL
jgi:hypothetical protein